MATDLQQDGFGLATTRRTLPIALLRARETVMDRFRPLLIAHNITEQQWRVLRVLDETNEIDASRLAVASCILAPSLTRILKTLEARGFIRAAKDVNDGRRTLVCLSRAGHGFLRRVAPESAAIYAEIEAHLGRDRIETLLDEIEVLLAALAPDDGS